MALAIRDPRSAIRDLRPALARPEELGVAEAGEPSDAVDPVREVGVGLADAGWRTAPGS